MTRQGWVAIHRQIQDHWLWEEKPFDKSHAWIDLLLLANHEDKKFCLGNELVEVKQGSLITSEVKLMERWGWGKSKTRAFLDLLQKDGMIIKLSDRKKTTITIVNYSDYAVLKTTGRPQTDHEQTASRPQADTNNNDNNVNNDNNKELYRQVADMYNSLCVSFPKLKTLSEARKKAIKARLKIYSLEQFKELFTKAEASDFLKGANNKNWSASFDWLIKDGNFAKVLDGNYDNKKVSKPKSAGTSYAAYDRSKFERMVADQWEEKEEPETAADNENIRARAEALKNQFQGEKKNA